MPPIPRGEDSQTRRMYLVLALFIIGVLALMGAQWWTDFDGGVDENGYLVAGRTLAEHHRLALIPDRSPGGECATFVGDMWVGADMGTPDERYYVKYPPGVPLLVAICWTIGGPETGRVLAYLLNPVGYCIGLFGVFLLVRRLAGSLPAIVAIACVAFSAPVVRLFNIPGSHGISFALLAWAALLLVWWMEEGRWWQAVFAGFLCGYAAISRAGESVLLAPLLLAIALHARSRRTALQAAAMILAWAVPVIAAAIVQRLATGAWTAYSATGEHSAFGRGYLVAHWPNTIQSLYANGIGLIFPLGAIGISIMLRQQWTAAVLLAWVAVNLLIYTAYYWSPANDMVIRGRFYLPSYAILAGGAMFAIVWIADRLVPKVRWLPTVLAIVIGGGSIVFVMERALALARMDVTAKLNLEERILWLEQRVPPDAVVLCDEIDMLDHLQFASNLTLHEHRLFNEDALGPLVVTNRLNSLDPKRPAYLQKRYLSLGQPGMTALRDSMIAGYIKAGRRVFVFAGPRRQFADFASLSRYGLVARRLDDYRSSQPGMPNVASDGVLDEIIPQSGE